MAGYQSVKAVRSPQAVSPPRAVSPAQAISSTRAAERGATPRRGWSLLLAAGAIGAVACTHLIDFGVYQLRYRIFDATSAASWSHLTTGGALAVGAVVCFAGARRLPMQRATWIATGVILALFFIDEASGLHADIDSLNRSLNYGKLLYAPILVILALCVWRLTRGTGQLANARAGAGLLLVSYLIHVLEPHNIARELGWSMGGWAFQGVVALKEGTELAGVLLALLALWGAAFQRGRYAAAAQARVPVPPSHRARFTTRTGAREDA
jgi:hypothetical protein